jgi:hypothetical protein
MVMQLCWQAPEIKGDLSVFKIVTPKSLDVKRGGKFAIANFVTLFTVKWI